MVTKLVFREIHVYFIVKRIKNMEPTKDTKSIEIQIKSGERKSRDYHFQPADVQLFNYLKSVEIPTNDCEIVLRNSKGEEHREPLSGKGKFASAFHNFSEFYLERNHPNHTATFEFQLVK